MTESTPTGQSTISGKVVIITVALVALTAAGYAWWSQWSRGQQVRTHFGADHARRIRYATDVRLLKLDPGRPQFSNGLLVEGAAVPIAYNHDVGDTPGMIHARQALIEDFSYDWERDVAQIEPQFDHAFIFRGDPRQPTDEPADEAATTIAFDLQNQVAVVAETNQRVALSDRLTEGLKTYFAEQDEKHANPENNDEN